MRPVGSGGGGHGVCEETERLQTRLLALEGCVLFPVGLKESSLCCFRLLMRVPSGLLRVSWPRPRKEMMQFWLLVSQADPLFRHHKERTFRQRFPVVLKSSDCINQLRAASGWIPTYLSRCDMSEPECSRFSVKLWCHSFRKDFTLFCSFCPTHAFLLPFHPQLVSILVIWPLHRGESWFGLFTLWIIISQISKLCYNQNYNNMYCIM